MQCVKRLLTLLQSFLSFNIELKEGTKPLHLFSPRSIPAGWRDKAKAEIDKMLQMEVIEPVEEPTEWCSGLTIVAKANGGIRVCVDLTALNKGVKRETYPLPRVSEMLSKLSEGKVFSKLDANSGFWQVVLAPECRDLTTFISPWGRFRFRRMCFGISSAPEYYQRAMEKILKNAEGVVCFMDDVLVFGPDQPTHWQRVKTVLERVSAAGMTLRKDKCQFGVESVCFLGHLLSGIGIQPDPEKVRAIREMNPPRCSREAKRFIGMVNYLSKFSKKLAELCVPIYSVMGKRNWYWGVDQQKAFDLVKVELSSSPVLCAFDLSRNHRVSADSSQYAVGAVLLQMNDSKDWQPVEYASRKLTDTETRYAMVEKEALAICWACEKFDYYLVGRIFEVETDHKPLVAILGDKDLSKLPLRVQRFKLRMMRYEYTIFHTPGSHMYLADSLSRPSEPCETSVYQCASVECFVDDYVEQNLLDDVREDELYQAIKTDEVALKILSFVEFGWPAKKSLSGELAKLFGSKDRITVSRGLILFNDRLYIPVNFRSIFLSRLHESHQGVEKTQKRARLCAWWPGMTVDIEEYITHCNVCIKMSAIKHQPYYKTVLPAKPWVEIATDVFELEQELFLLIVDYYTRWIEVCKIPFQTSSAIISVIKSVFPRLGVPNKVRSDNASYYVSSDFQAFARSWGFKTATSSP